MRLLKKAICDTRTKSQHSTKNVKQINALAFSLYHSQHSLSARALISHSTIFLFQMAEM